MEDRLEKYLRFIREVERLKSVERTAWTTSGRRESTAEHSWRLALLAMVLCGEYPRLDRLRVLQLALVHDLGETYDGDIPAVAQGDPAAKERVERAAVERLAGCLPEGAGRELRGVWEEYEACRTPEAKLVKGRTLPVSTTNSIWGTGRSGSVRTRCCNVCAACSTPTPSGIWKNDGLRS